MARSDDHAGRPGSSGRPPVRPQGGRPSGPSRGQGAPRRPQPSRQVPRSAEISRVHSGRRRRRRHNYILYYIALAILLVTVGVTLSLNLFFKVKNIEVSGTSLYTHEQVLEALDAKQGDNLLRLKTKRLEQAVYERLVQAEKVDIRRRFPNTLSVDVTDAVVTEQIVSRGYSYQISSGGRVVSVLPDAVPNVRIVLGPEMQSLEPGDLLNELVSLDEKAAASKDKKDEEEYTNTRRLEVLAAMRNEIDRAGLMDISMVDVSDSVGLKMLYQNRFEIRLGTSSELQDKLAMFASVLDRGSLGLEEMGILDISDPDRCIASRDLPALPDGAVMAGWRWFDPHLENFDEFFGYAGGGSPVTGGVLVGGAEQTPAGVQTPGTVPETAPGTSSGEGGITSGVTGDGTQPGYMMPQVPNIGGNSSLQQEQEPSSAPADEPVSDEGSSISENDISSSAEEEEPEEASSQPGYAMPSIPQIGG